MQVRSATPGALGFDVNQPLTEVQCADFVKAGYQFCIRYIPRTVALVRGNLTQPEVDVILGSGLCLIVVQHTPLPGWMPSASLGKEYGDYAALYAELIGLPKGINIFLDLEEVSVHAIAQDVIDYAQAWYNSVNAAGYLPGLYVGWCIFLSPTQLYKNLSYKTYWKAYNGGDVATRGYQIIQHPKNTLNGIPFDPNTAQADNMGDSALWLSPS